MDDRFRFRAWVADENILRDVLYLDLREAYESIICWDSDGYQHRYDSTEYILMQCTGLKDKNGRLIFEGDIVLAASQKWKCKVVWENENARFICYTNEKPCKLVYVGMVDKGNLSVLEIIGNIYENPELLEVDR